jgi:glycine betaine/proline transport system ATP-binding protein
MLHKTIVFITHDFDEAIRLADRIAIMKDGEIIQIGAPEALVLNPANDYVAEFTRDIPRAKVLTTEAIMEPLENGQNLCGQVPMRSKIAEVSEQVVDADGDVAVVDDDGKTVGRLSRDTVLAVLVGKGAAS